MNYANLLARGLLILYCIFLLLFAFGEGILKEGYMHAIHAVAILVVLVLFNRKPVVSSLTFFFLFVFSIWFFKTYNNAVYFFIVSAPLMMASVLFIIGKRSASI